MHNHLTPLASHAQWWQQTKVLQFIISFNLKPELIKRRFDQPDHLKLATSAVTTTTTLPPPTSHEHISIRSIEISALPPAPTASSPHFAGSYCPGPRNTNCEYGLVVFVSACQPYPSRCATSDLCSCISPSPILYRLLNHFDVTYDCSAYVCIDAISHPTRRRRRRPNICHHA